MAAWRRWPGSGARRRLGRGHRWRRAGRGAATATGRGAGGRRRMPRSGRCRRRRSSRRWISS
ncbi:hypothetical protein GQ55_1G452500 [Panicum hallii var. hallii]|uniref:Uncharacterized protein n=1 Tax=Panicum hallii var. hallii TaxID=1504633 RepID=A0A2T7FEE4_9POAL|nr:hypothetical protein GQ55_1G452500 [Panicum hallii var. hallii]